jgi:hypothetical protein
LMSTMRMKPSKSSIIFLQVLNNIARHIKVYTQRLRMVALRLSPRSGQASYTRQTSSIQMSSTKACSGVIFYSGYVLTLCL